MTKRRGQTTLEYVAAFVLIIGAIVAMVLYMKRGYMGKLRETSDEIGGGFTPLNTSSNYTRTTNGSQSDKRFDNGQTDTNITKMEADRTGSETVDALSGEKLF